ncbi:unnamed protein product [Agarophyton chilense]
MVSTVDLMSYVSAVCAELLQHRVNTFGDIITRPGGATVSQLIGHLDLSMGRANDAAHELLQRIRAAIRSGSFSAAPGVSGVPAADVVAGASVPDRAGNPEDPSTVGTAAQAAAAPRGDEETGEPTPGRGPTNEASVQARPLSSLGRTVRGVAHSSAVSALFQPSGRRSGSPSPVPGPGNAGRGALRGQRGGSRGGRRRVRDFAFLPVSSRISKASSPPGKRGM